jgi:GNAT superfamily N-acetyltransferase
VIAPSIRPARLAEKPALDALCFRAKAHWGYDADFMEKSREALRVPKAAILGGRAFVAEGPHGVAVLGAERGEIVLLESLFIEPAFIGKGIGAALFRHAAAVARADEAHWLEIHADPFAAGFYDRMGAERTGAVPSGRIAGRMLPLFRFVL